MKYQCGHSACDLCGGHRRCDPNAGQLQNISNLLVCNFCLNRAVRFTYDVACRFGGTVIDITKPCARPSPEEKPRTRIVEKSGWQQLATAQQQASDQHHD